MSSPQEDTEQLLNAMLAPAEAMLLEHGYFFPYGGAMKADGEIVSLGGMTGLIDPTLEELLDTIKAGLRAGAESGSYRATALVSPADVTDADEVRTACIALDLEHRDDYAVLVLIPWQLEEGELAFGEAIAQQGSRKFFSP